MISRRSIFGLPVGLLGVTFLGLENVTPKVAWPHDGRYLVDGHTVADPPLIMPNGTLFWRSSRVVSWNDIHWKRRRR